MDIARAWGVGRAVTRSSAESAKKPPERSRISGGFLLRNCDWAASTALRDCLPFLFLVVLAMISFIDNLLGDADWARLRFAGESSCCSFRFGISVQIWLSL